VIQPGRILIIGQNFINILRNLEESKRQVISRLLSILVLIVGTVTILFYYRRGGAVDSIYGSNSQPGLRDMGIYMRAAQDLLAQKSPYDFEGLAFRSGTFGVMIFSILGAGSLGFFISQLLNLAGFAYFSIVMFRSTLQAERILILVSVGIWFSCLREVFSTGQITGIITGLLAWGFQNLKTLSYRGKFFSGLAFSLALDLKPNLVLFFIITSYIFFQKIKDIWIPIVILVIGHALIDIYTQTILEKDWFAVLSSVSDPDRDPTNTGTRTIWPIIRLLLNGEVVARHIPTLIFILLGVALIIAISRNLNIRWVYASLMLPVFYNYFHLYSFFSIAILILGIGIEKRRPVMLGVTLPFLLISGSNFSIQHLIFSTLICVYLVIMLGMVRALTWSECRIFLMTATSIIVIRYFVVLATGSHYISEILILNFLVFLGALVLLRDKVSPVN
jgi:hypothetical protein